MNKCFYHLKMEHIKGLSWWFWTREAFAMLNDMVSDIVKDLFAEPIGFLHLEVWFSLIVLVPLMYFVVPSYGAVVRRKYVIICIINKVSSGIEIYNKKNIEYFTLLVTLYGGQEDEA